MKLQIDEYPVTSLEWGAETAWNDGRMTVSREEIMDWLEQSGLLQTLEITELEIVRPHTETRVINIFEVLPAHARLGDGASSWPGVLDPVQTVGNGRSASLTRFSALAVSSLPSRYNKILDKSGPGSEMTPYHEHFHIAVKTAPVSSEMGKAEYYAEMKRIGLSIGSFLARKASETAAPESRLYALDETPKELPRVVFVCMLTALQHWEKGEPTLYGNDLYNMMPTVLHPNELLDGCVVAMNFNLGIDTYSFQNNGVIRELYARHGKDLCFVGVIVCGSHITRDQRERSVMMTEKLVCDILGADLAVLNKLGGGIPESDLMLTIESLEKRGVKTTGIIWSHQGNGTIKDILTAASTAADALVSVGVNDAPLELPEQSIVVGGSAVDPASDDPDALPQDATEVIHIRCRELCGAINQLGNGYVAMMEI